MPFITQGKTNWKFLLIVVILTVIVGVMALGYQYWWMPRSVIEPFSGGKKSIITDDSGRIVVAEIKYPSEFKGVLMELHIEGDQMSILSKPEIANGYPNYFSGSYDFMARVISFNGDILEEYGFSDPRVILGEQGYQGPTWLDSVDFTLIIPYFEDTQKINIFSPTKLMLSVNISDLVAK